MMTCRELIEFLMAYDNDELPEDQRAVFETHICHCAPCKDFMETYRTTVKLAKEACCDKPDAAPPPQVPDKLVEAILKARQTSE